MFDPLQLRLALLMNRVRVNRVQPAKRDGSDVFVKRRRVGGSAVIWLGNRFLALARSGVTMFVRVDEWVDWEVHCSRLLYPEGPAVVKGSRRSVILPRRKGISLRELLRQKRAPAVAFVAAARELRRAHQLTCSHFGDGWSHGDLHLDNIVYDPDTDQAAFIDFDTRHEVGLDRLRRQSDDLRLMLLELLGVPHERWHEWAAAIIEEYAEPRVLAHLERQLKSPAGCARILWHTRTRGSTHAVEQRLETVRTILRRAASQEASCSTGG